MKRLDKREAFHIDPVLCASCISGKSLAADVQPGSTRIVGSFLKEDALAAVGATSPLSGLIIGFLMGLANGFAIVTAQKFGAGSREEVRKSFALSLVMGSVISLILTVFRTFCFCIRS